MTHSYTSYIENWPNSYIIFQILPIDILFMVKKIPHWYTFDVKMIPIHILGGLKRIPHSSCTPVYTFIMEVTTHVPGTMKSLYHVRIKNAILTCISRYDFVCLMLQSHYHKRSSADGRWAKIGKIGRCSPIVGRRRHRFWRHVLVGRRLFLSQHQS